MTDSNPIPALADIPQVPTNADAELVFNNPWEARAFALVVQLYQQGHFTWPEWSACLGEEIATAASDDDSTYYLLWLSAAEKLVAAKRLCPADSVAQRKRTLEAAQGGATGAPAHA